MTVNTISNKVTAIGNGVTVNFAINFQFYIKSDLIVTFDDELINISLYNVTGGGGSTGEIVFLTPPANNVNIEIFRVLPLVQQAAFTRNDPFPAKSHEIALDRIVMMIQQIEGGSGSGGGEVSPEFIQDIVASMFGPGVGITFAYDDDTGTILATVTSPGLEDAPSDNIYYVRRNGNWIQMAWGDIVGKPATFPPDVHTHTSAAITDLTENTQDLVGPMLAHSGHTNISFTYDDTTGLINAIASQAGITTGVGEYDWDDTSTMADPGLGKIRGNGGPMNSISNLAISKTDKNNLLPDIFALVVGDIIIISNITNPTPGKFTIGSITDNAGWVQFGVTPDLAYTTGNPVAGDDLKVSGVAASGGGGGIGEAPNDGTYYTRRNLGWIQGAYSGLSGIPSSFPPNPHTHVVADISDFPADLVHGPASSVTGNLPAFSNTTGKILVDSGKLAANVVLGPASSVDTRIALFDLTTGKLLKQAGIGVDTNGKPILIAGIAGSASINVPHGVAPTTPVNGDIWTTTAGVFVRVNGVTTGPLSLSDVWIASAAGTNTITGVGTPVQTAYRTGGIYRFTAASNNTGATTINVDGLGAKNLRKNGQALIADDIILGVTYSLLYDGTNMLMISSSAGL